MWKLWSKGGGWRWLKARAGCPCYERMKTRAQLTTEELQQLRWLLGGVLTLLSVATVFYLDVDAWTLSGLTALAVVIGIAKPEWIGRVPAWVHRLAFPVVAAFFAADLWWSGELLPAIVRLDLLLLLYRSVMYRKKRDDLQLVVLGLFLIVVAGVLSVAVTFAVHILAFVGCALVFLLVVTMSEGSRGQGAGGEEDSVPSWAGGVRWARLLGRARQATDWRVVALGGGLFGALVVLSGLLFLAIPRFQLESGFFLERFMSKKARTGFSDSIRFGDVTEITQDNSVALSVDVSDPSRIPASPYWRMMVLDEYRDGTFRLSAALRAGGFGREWARTDFPPARAVAGEGAGYWTFYLESGVSRYLPLLGEFQRVQFRERQNFRYSRALRVLALRDDPVSMTAYRVEGMDTDGRLTDEVFAAQWKDGGESALVRATSSVELGEEDRAVLEDVVREIAGERRGNLDAQEFARAAEAWLEQGHGYSLSPTVPEGPGDPLVRWLRSGGGGHCELFAGSLVLLARTAGFPARVVTGFRGGSWNAYSNNFTLRNADAHAWVEIFDAATESWLRADPTPGAAAAAAREAPGEEGLAQRLDRSWTARLDSLRVFWYRRIVNFDQQSQLETLRAVKEATENVGARLRAWIEAAGETVREWIRQPWDVRRTGTIVIAGMVLAAVLAWVLRRGGFSIFDFRFSSGRRRSDAVRMEAGKWLRRVGACRARDVQCEAVARELERLRFGARETWGEPKVVFRGARRAWRGARKNAR